MQTKQAKRIQLQNKSNIESLNANSTPKYTNIQVTTPIAIVKYIFNEYDFINIIIGINNAEA